MQRKAIALTIDDGVSMDTTPIILEALRETGIKATFFVIGSKAEKHKELLTNIATEGHLLANHDYVNAVSLFRYWRDPKKWLDQVQATQKIINDIQPPRFNASKWFRPGCGWYTYSMIRALEKLNYTTIIGDVYPHDPQIPSSKFMTYYVDSKMSNGSVIIVHDGTTARARNTAKFIRKIHKKATKKGYFFKTLDEMKLEV